MTPSPSKPSPYGQPNDRLIIEEQDEYKDAAEPVKPEATATGGQSTTPGIEIAQMPGETLAELRKSAAEGEIGLNDSVMFNQALMQRDDEA